MDEPNNKAAKGTPNDAQARPKKYPTASGSEAELGLYLPQIESVKATKLEPSPTRRATGPRSEAGKRKSSKNATRQGIFAKGVLIVGESSRQFYSLQRLLQEDIGALEEIEGILIEKLATILWRQARFLKAEGTEILKAMEFAEVDRFGRQAFNFDGSSSQETDQLQARQEHIAGTEPPQTLWKKLTFLLPPSEILERLMAYERHLGRELDRVLTQVERIRRMRTSQPEARIVKTRGPRRQKSRT